MSLTIVKGSWEMAQDLWSLRWAAMQEAGHKPSSGDQLARIQWETSGQLIQDNFLVIMAYDELQPVGYIAITHGNVVGLHDKPGFYVVGWYVKPEWRRGPVGLRLGLSAAKVARDMKIGQLQGIVANEMVAGMLERHGFRSVGTVYERGLSSGSELRPAAGTQVHRQAG